MESKAGGGDEEEKKVIETEKMSEVEELKESLGDGAEEVIKAAQTGSETKG